MLKKIKIILILTILLVSIELYGNKKLPVMLKVRSNFSLDSSIINTLRSGAEEILTTKGYELISKNQQEEALKEQRGQEESACLDDTCLVDTGKMLAAQKFLIIDINRVKNEYFFKGKMINLETGAIERTIVKVYNQDISNITKLLNFSKELTIEALGTEKRVHYFIPYGFTDLTAAKDILFLSFGLGFKFVKLKIGKKSTIELNGKAVFNFTDSVSYFDFEVLYKYTILKKINIGAILPIRYLSEIERFGTREFGILPSLLLNYNIIKKYGLFIDFDFLVGVALRFDGQITPFVNSGINFGYEF